MLCCLSRIRPPSSLYGIPEGNAGKRITAAHMARLVRTEKRDPAVRAVALALTRHLAPYDHVGEVGALHSYVRDEIRYVEDIEGVETVQGPAYTLEVGAGDCDDKATCLCALLACIGYRTCFFLVGFDGVNYEHVLSGVYLGTRCLPLETVIPAGSAGPGSAEIGWLPPDANPVLPWNI